MGSSDHDSDTSMQTALDDLLRERDLVDDAIDKLQKLLATLQSSTPKKSRVKPSRRSKARGPTRKQA